MDLSEANKILCGIDEAGRGPLAGPLVIAGVVLLKKIDGLRDSKKLNAAKREKLYRQIVDSSHYHIVIFSNVQIDDNGISACLRDGLKEIMNVVDATAYLFDGNSTFGVCGLETLVKADDKVDEVSAASILAKVTRDRMMADYAVEYPEYGFEKHNGYGTKYHIEMIKKYGRCDIHRYSFRVKSLDEPTLF